MAGLVDEESDVWMAEEDAGVDGGMAEEDGDARHTCKDYNLVI